MKSEEGLPGAGGWDEDPFGGGGDEDIEEFGVASSPKRRKIEKETSKGLFFFAVKTFLVI